MINLVDIIKTAALAKGWHFVLYDLNSYQSEINKLDLTQGQKVLTMLKSAPIPVFENGMYQHKFKQTPRLMLGSKFVNGIASHDETYQQKYDNRIKGLEEELINFVVSLNCNNKLLSISVDGMEHITNFGSMQIDAIECGLNMTIENIIL